MTDPNTLRRQLRKARRNLSKRERADATKAALARIQRLPRYMNARRVALYVGADGELCPLTLADGAGAQGKIICLPVLHPFRAGRLLFCAWKAGERLRKNRFGIPEPIPSAGNVISPRRLDVVITPLLGFDERGHRLGMGGGYYDRTFAFRRRHPRWRRPFMLGLAHDVQKTFQLQSEPWDVPLDAVVTNVATYLYRYTSTTQNQNANR